MWGDCCRCGYGVTKDWSEAAAMYRRAADQYNQGDIGDNQSSLEAEFSLANMYGDGGHGLERNAREARSLLIR